MITIKMIETEAAAEDVEDGEDLMHYGVSKLDGAPGRGSGRYELDSGKNPRASKRRGVAAKTASSKARGEGTFSTVNETGKGGGRRELHENRMPEHCMIDGEYLISFEMPFSGRRINIGKKPHIWKKSVPKALIRSADLGPLKKAFPNEFPRGEVAPDNETTKKYKDLRDKYCGVDPETGLHKWKTYIDEDNDALDEVDRYGYGNDPDYYMYKRHNEFLKECYKAGIGVESDAAKKMSKNDFDGEDPKDVAARSKNLSSCNLTEEGDFSKCENSTSCVIAQDLRSKGYEVTSKAFTESQNDAILLDAYNIKKMQYYDGKINAAHGMLRQGYGASGYLGVNFVTGGGQAFYYKIVLTPFGRAAQIYNPQVSDKPIGTIRSNRKGTKISIPNKELRNTFRWIDDNNICVTRLDNAKINAENISKYVD